MRSITLLVLALSSACRCGGPVLNVEPPNLSVAPAALLFPATWVGRSAALSLEVSNTGATTSLTPSVTGPFTLSTTSLSVARGSTETLTVRFEPSMAGTATGLVTLAEGLAVPITASAMTPPMCLASATCFESSFDFDAAMCVERQRPSGAACTTNCITGTCSGDTCVGQSRSCDDGDACTIDACDETLGCVSSPRTCQASTNPCLETRCDPRLGCVNDNAPDGLVCGRDDCLATQVDVCISGACVTRTRPASARCVNRWVPLAPNALGNSLEWDRRRGRVVMLSSSTLTWELTGSTWALRTPLAKPPFGGGLMWDPMRQRVVFFELASLWEWDGTTWVNRPAPGLPSTFRFNALAFDEKRGRAVMVNAQSTETWEWNGTNWSLRSMTAPSDVRFFHYDEVRQQVVAPAAGLAWTGQRWEPIEAGTAPTCTGGMARDSTRHRLVLKCDTATWEWDGSTWTSSANVPPGRRISSPLVFDGTAGRVVMFGGETDDTWVWNGSTWTELIGPTNPPRLGSPSSSLAWDSRRGRLVLGQTHAFTARFWSPDGGRWQEWPDAGLRAVNSLSLTPDVDGGLLMVADSEPLVAQPLTAWTWDGTSWARHPTVIPNRTLPGLATDQTRGRAVLFGGAQPQRRDTWEWNGASWVEGMGPTPDGPPVALGAWASGMLLLTGLSDGGTSTWSWSGATWSRLPTAHQPPYFMGAMAFDPPRNKLLLYLYGADQTWEWTGSDWVESTIEDTPSGSIFPSMAFDEASQRMTLWNGAIWVLLR